MTQRIRRFGVAQTAKFFGVMYALIGLIALPIFVLVAMVAPRQAGFGLGLAILLPICYGLLGFVFSAIGCLVYNAVASWVGGIEIELGESAS